MTKARIVKRTHPSGIVGYVIQQRHFLFKWWWIDARFNTATACRDSFPTLQQAKDNLWQFDGSKPTEEVVE